MLGDQPRTDQRTSPIGVACGHADCAENRDLAAACRRATAAERFTCSAWFRRSGSRLRGLTQGRGTAVSVRRRPRKLSSQEVLTSDRFLFQRIGDRSG